MRPVRSLSCSIKPLVIAAGLLAVLSGSYAAEEIKVKHILVATQEEAAQIRTEIVAQGGDRKAFTAACRKYSKDVSTKRLGGTLSWMSERDGYDAAFKAAAFALKDDEISQPVQSQFGWHLIYLTERRDRSNAAAAAAPKPAPVSPAPAPTPAQESVPQPQNQLAPTASARPQNDTLSAQAAAVVPSEPVKAERSRLPQKRLNVVLESGKRTGTQHALFRPEQALEVNLYMKNGGQEELTVFPPEVLALGLTLTAIGERVPMTADFSSVPEPENMLMPLKPYQIVGHEMSLNDYYKVTQGRYKVSWDKDSFFTQLESRFPQVTSLPDYAAVKASLNEPGVVSRDRIVRAYPHRSASRDGLNMSVFEQIRAAGTYYAELKLRGEPRPVVIELDVAQQFVGARHFAQLAMSGFYDNLDFYDVRPGDYLLGGSPTGTGTGAPDMRLPQVRNTAQLKHERGTVSFVSRSIRKGPVSGGEIGSIFFVLLRDRPEWDKEHVPFGKVVSGLDLLENVTNSARFETITILTEEDRTAVAAAPGSADATATTAATTTATTTGNPEALIKTSKGDLVVELLESEARNTVANFITLAEDGFYDETAEGGAKQTFFNLIVDAKGARLAIQAGSPTNDVDGGPGYTISSEPNQQRHSRGALSMVQKYVEQDGQFVPDSAGSQFFICMNSIPWYDTHRLTVFGRVKTGFEILDQLAEGDTIESIEITKKKTRSYTVRKVP